MLKGNYLLMILTMNHLIFETMLSEGEYGEKCGLYPKSSCVTLFNVETTGRCFLGCLNALDVHYMFSHNVARKQCLCCFDLSGYDVTSFQWKTYIPRPCKHGYITYNYTEHQICLKMVRTYVPYLEAAARCQAEGADLFKIDTKLKYDILTDYLAPFTKGGSIAIDVWVQGEKVGEEWLFHDGSTMPLDSDDVCPRIFGSDPKEVHIRASTSLGSSKFFCRDMLESKPFHYLCEYSRSFSFMK